MKLFGLDINRSVGRKYSDKDDEVPIMIQVVTEDGQMGGEIEDYAIYDNQAKAYNQFVWIYAAVKRISNTAAMIPFSVYKKDGENLVPVTNHPFEELINDPHPFVSRFELWEQTITHLELQGNVYWLITRDASGDLSQIDVIRPHEMVPHPHYKRYIDYYTYFVNHKEKQISAESIVHFKKYHPRKKYVGLSAIEAAARPLDLEDKIHKYNRSFFGNNATPRGLLVTDQILTPELQKRVERAWRERFKGEEQSHKTSLLMGGVKFQPVALPPKDAEFVMQKELDRDEILAIFGVSTANLGIVKDVNKSNAEAMYYTLIRDTIRPSLVRIQEKLTSRVLKKEYGPEFVGKFEEVSSETKDQILSEMGVVARTGAMTLNEFRKKYLKLKDVDGGEVLMGAMGGKDLDDFISDIKGIDYDRSSKDRE